jgi:outer membrane protein OmpA-like peptidoglycan-associated protein
MLMTMKKNLLFSLLLLVTTFIMAQSGNFAVQVGAFDTKVDDKYFEKLGKVSYMKDHNDIHRYYFLCFDKAEAESKAENAKKQGFRAVVIDNEEVAKNCRVTCGIVKTPAPAALDKLNWIFFDFDKADLRGASKNQLDILSEVLAKNPTYTAELSAHTDAKGSDTYNVALSERRANNAKNYVVGKGVSLPRLKISTNGETAPIAKNEVSGGKDTETGRQFNRRVEIKVFDGSGKQVNMVEMPMIPTDLKS